MAQRTKEGRLGFYFKARQQIHSKQQMFQKLKQGVIQKFSANWSLFLENSPFRNGGLQQSRNYVSQRVWIPK